MDILNYSSNNYRKWINFFILEIKYFNLRHLYHSESHCFCVFYFQQPFWGKGTLLFSHFSERFKNERMNAYRLMRREPSFLKLLFIALKEGFPKRWDSVGWNEIWMRNHLVARVCDVIRDIMNRSFQQKLSNRKGITWWLLFWTSHPFGNPVWKLRSIFCSIQL